MLTGPSGCGRRPATLAGTRTAAGPARVTAGQDTDWVIVAT
jgi:hypothetical protein